MNTLTSEKPIFFKNLDILRFFAAIIVVIAHAYEGRLGWYQIPSLLTEDGNSEKLSSVGKIVDTGIKNGGFGVDIFFLISGFLITFLLLKEKENFGKINIFKFYMRRSIRIWPMYFLIIILGPFIIWAAKWPVEPDYLPNLLFYNNFHSIHLADWQYPFAHLWSICVEEHFYLFWPFVIAFIPLKYLYKVFVLLILATISYRIYLFSYDFDWKYNYLHTFSRIDVLIFGALFALYFFKNGFKVRTNKWFRLTLYAMFLVAYLLEPVYLVDSLYAATLKKYFFVLIVGFGMTHFILNPKPLIVMPFQKFFNYLGKISFGIYLLSNVLIPVIIVRFLHRWETDNIAIYFLMNLVLTIGLSALAYELYEKQFLKLKKKFELIKTQRQ